MVKPLDTRHQLVGFFKLSQNDLEVNSQSAVASEKAAYVGNKAADTNTDGKITYSEYLNYLNKVTPNSVSKYDLVLSKVLPLLRDFSFSETGAMVGSGVLSETHTLPGEIVLTAGARVSILADGLLVSNVEKVYSAKYEVTLARNSAALLPFNVISGNSGFFSIFPQPCIVDVLATAKTLVSSRNVVNTILAETFQWFHENPPDVQGINFAARREHSLLLDQLGHEIPQEVWSDYYFDWDKKGLRHSTTIEFQYPILQYLRMAEQKVLEEVRSTKLTEGVRIWQMYNLGIIVKTPDKCFAIDLIPVTTDFTSVLDFAVVSHSDPDHVDNDFVPAMLRLGKTVYSPVFDKNIWIMQLYPKLGTMKITKDTIINQGDLTLYFKLSAQGDIPCLVTTVDCGVATGSFTLMHGGDSSIANDYATALEIDFLNVHSGNEYPVVAQSNPRLVNLSHNLELSHPLKWRNKYQDCYDSLGSWLNGLVPERTMVLTWGESMVFSKK